MKFLSLVLFSILLISCGDDNNSPQASQSESIPAPENQEQPNPDTQEDIIPQPVHHTACFPGRDQQGNTCFVPTYFEDLPNLDGYIYPDPFGPDFLPSRDPYQYIPPDRALDLSVVKPNTFLSPYFKVKEFMRENKARFGLFSADVVIALTLMRERMAIPLVLNSAYRAPSHNQSVGGAKWSRHMYGDAVDIRVTNDNHQELKSGCIFEGAGYVELYETHVHCDWRDTALDPNFFPPVQRPAAQIFSNNFVKRNHKIEAEVGPDYVVFASNSSFKEDHDHRLLHQWTINLPNGDVIQSMDSRLTLPKLSGHYSISLVLGGRHHLNKRIFVQQ